MSYDGAAAARATVTIRDNPLAPAASAGQNGAPDFEHMSAEQRRAYHKDRLTRKFG